MRTCRTAMRRTPRRGAVRRDKCAFSDTIWRPSNLSSSCELVRRYGRPLLCDLLQHLQGVYRIFVHPVLSTAINSCQILCALKTRIIDRALKVSLPLSLAKMSFDEILDPTADVFFYICSMLRYVSAHPYLRRTNPTPQNRL